MTAIVPTSIADTVASPSLRTIAHPLVVLIILCRPPAGLASLGQLGTPNPALTYMTLDAFVFFNDSTTPGNGASTRTSPASSR